MSAVTTPSTPANCNRSSRPLSCATLAPSRRPPLVVGVVGLEPAASTATADDVVVERRAQFLSLDRGDTILGSGVLDGDLGDGTSSLNGVGAFRVGEAERSGRL